MAIVVALGMLFIAGPVMAAESATQTINYSVGEINAISLNDTSILLAVDVTSVTVGSEPGQAKASSSYNITINSTGTKKITAALEGPEVTGLTFRIDVQPPPTGSTIGETIIVAGDPAITVVEGITKVAEPDIMIHYTLDATVEAGKIDNGSKKITFTLASPS